MTKDGEIKLASIEDLQKIEALEAKLQLREGLPFLYGWKWYKWAKEFYDSQNKINLLCAANQISKSSTQIRKCINWATNQDLWPELWLKPPTQFWYLYPTSSQANAEFLTKWKLFLPTGKYKDDPIYGWTELRKGQNILGIKFNSGVYVFFKTYSQNAQALQTGTVDAIFCDEELPLVLYEELMFRLTAVNGYFHMVFTATLGQDFWRRALEPGENEKEELIGASKQVVSLYDALYYEDGSPSQWTEERISQIRARCSTHQEVERRVYGKFIVAGGRKYEMFDIKRHLKPRHQLNKNWLIYCGVDIGSGDVDGHPSAIVFVAVRPDFRAGRVFLGWRGDGIKTTSGDVVEKYIAMVKENKLTTTARYYDWQNKDFFEIASRMNHGFEKAEKGHDIGEDIINTLFANDMIYIYEDEELGKLAGELASLRKTGLKRNAKDDMADAFRYCVTKIPWDFSVITGATDPLAENPDKPLSEMQRQINDRRKAFEDTENAEKNRIEDEFKEWNEAYGSES